MVIRNKRQLPFLWLLLCCYIVFSSPLIAESQPDGDYKGINDPFGDPANYEFAEDEKADKEFFHLGRFLMFGVDFGVGVYTGGLGKTISPGFCAGGKLIYFLDKLFAMEAAIHYSKQLDVVTPTSSQTLEVDTTLIPINVGLRYYFDIKNAPRAIAIANPYLALGGGVYLRSQNITRNIGFSLQSSDATTSNFGGYGGAGVEFNVYRRNVYLGMDVRYHMIFFNDESDNFGVTGVDRSGDFFNASVSLTYNF